MLSAAKHLPESEEIVRCAQDDIPANPSVAVIGGGLAGMAAAAALAERGLRVELFEAHPRLGGRAGATRDPHTGATIDYCQHVALGCCTNLLDFLRRTGIADEFQRYTSFHFVSPEGKPYCVASSRLLPAPLHLASALMRLGYLTLRERWAILAALGRLAREPGNVRHEHETIGAWLCRHGQSRPMIERFWSVVLQSALSESVDRISLAAARKVFVDGFLSSRRAHELVLSRVPLGELLSARVRAWLMRHGVKVRTAARARQVEGDAAQATGVVLAGGARQAADFVVVAVPWHQVPRLLHRNMLSAVKGLEETAALPTAPITAVHLWFDRPITSLPHAALVGRTVQWVFAEGGAREAEGEEEKPECGGRKARGGHYCQTVISASHALVKRPRDEVLAEVLSDLRAVFAAVGDARLLHWRVITHRSAVFSPRPGVDDLRPSQQTAVAGLVLAGDWTATGWPATMEGAVRSGHLAAEAVLRALKRPDRVLVPDLPRGWLARFMLGVA